MLELTWQQMLKLEPRLSEVDDYLAHCAVSWRSYEEAKRRMKKYIGFTSENAKPELAGNLAYEAGIQHITDKLGI